MRISYVCYNITSNQMDGGVGKKIRTQKELWEQQGCKVELCYTGMNITPDPADRYFPIETLGKKGVVGFISQELSRNKQLRELLKQVAAFQPDIIYIRHGIYTFPLHRLFRIAPVVFEVNALDVEEIKNRSFLHRIVHRLTRSWILNKASGIVALSGEIANHPSFQNFRKPKIVIANGVLLDEGKQISAPENDKPRIVFSISEDHYWQGLDKLIQLALSSPDFNFDVIGVAAKETPEVFPENIRFHGFISDADVYEKIISHCDVGVGPLAWYRKNMIEGSPLKVREYLVNGIPVVTAHLDTDIPDSFPYLLRLPNTEDNVSSKLPEIQAFIRDMQHVRVPQEAIRPFISARDKEKKRLLFFQELL